MQLSISILNSKNKIETINILNKTEISYIHLDVMDGEFVSQKSLSIEEIKNLSKISEKKLDVHLMVSNPIDYIEAIKDIPNLEYITIHLEISKNIEELLTKIKSYGYKCGLSIKPGTDINELNPYLDMVDLILLMTVEPGKGGQPFIESSVARLNELKKQIKNNTKIEVDGGINNQTIKKVKEADISVVGSYVTTSDNIVEKINSLLV